MISDYIHETDNAYLENMHREGMGEKETNTFRFK